VHHSPVIDFPPVLASQMIIARRPRAMQISAGGACDKIPCCGLLGGCVSFVSIVLRIFVRLVGGSLSFGLPFWHCCLVGFGGRLAFVRCRFWCLLCPLVVLASPTVCSCSRSVVVPSCRQ